MLYRWNEFLEEGDELYTFMVNNFENMFDGESIIKHFDIRRFYFSEVNTAVDMLDDEEYTDIQKELSTWVKKEKQEGRLFDKTLWKPFRDFDLIEMYNGYRKLFQYKHYYFQLGMETVCMIKDCPYCDPEEDETASKHFVLEIYGWEGEDKIGYPYRCDIPEDNIIQERYWARQ
jgi:hypothetical protein